MCSIVSADTSAHVHDVTGTWEFVTGVSAEVSSSESSVSASTFAPTAADSDSCFIPSFFPLSPWYLPTWFHHQSVL